MMTDCQIKNQKFILAIYEDINLLESKMQSSAINPKDRFYLVERLKETIELVKDWPN